MIVNFSNHPSNRWSTEQLEAAQAYGELKDYDFPMVNPEDDEKDVEELANRCVREILEFHPDAVLVQGEFTVCYSVIRKLKERNIICLAACSAREAVEEKKEDGSVRKESIFRFCGFREYR